MRAAARLPRSPAWVIGVMALAVAALMMIAECASGTRNIKISDAELFGLMPDPGWEAQDRPVVSSSAKDELFAELAELQLSSDVAPAVPSDPPITWASTSQTTSPAPPPGTTVRVLAGSDCGPDCECWVVLAGMPPDPNTYYEIGGRRYRVLTRSQAAALPLSGATYYTRSYEPVSYSSIAAPPAYYSSPVTYSRPRAVYRPFQPVRNIGRAIYNARTVRYYGGFSRPSSSSSGWSYGSGSYGSYGAACVGGS